MMKGGGSAGGVSLKSTSSSNPVVDLRSSSTSKKRPDTGASAPASGPRSRETKLTAPSPPGLQMQNFSSESKIKFSMVVTVLLYFVLSYYFKFEPPLVTL